MRTVDLFRGSIKRARQLINTPYKYKDVLVIVGIVIILLAIPMTVISVYQVGDLRSRAAGDKLELLPGWPQSFDKQSVLGSPTMADVDNDGDLEMIVITEKQIAVFNHDGSMVSGWPRVFRGYSFSEDSSPAVADIDNDGDLEIFFGSVFSVFSNGVIHALHHDGTDVEGWPQSVEKPRRFGTPVIGDLDNDGDLEIITGTYQKGVVELEPFNKFYAWHHDGILMEGWPKKVLATDDRDYGFRSTPAIADLDGNGYLEIVTATKKVLYAWHHDSQNVKGWPKREFKSDALLRPPSIGDLDNDGDLEIVDVALDGVTRTAYIYAWNADGTSVAGWPTLVNASGYTLSLFFNEWNTDVLHDIYAPVLGDLDNDGDLEIIIAGTVDKIFGWGFFVEAWHHDDKNGDNKADLASGFPIFIGDLFKKVSLPVLADINSDGNVEIVVGATLGDNYAWRLYAFYNDGVNGHKHPYTIDGFPLPKSVNPSDPYQWWRGGTGPRAVSIGDMDSDGDLEIAIVNTSGGTIAVYTMPWTPKNKNNSWETYHHDVRRTGFQDVDSDNDGFTNTVENYLSTDPFDACPDNRRDGAWPPDFDNNRIVNVVDAKKYKGRTPTIEGDKKYKKRYDLDANGILNAQDVNILKQFLNTSCNP